MGDGLLVRIEPRPERRGEDPPGRPAPTAKREAIVREATALFLRQGFQDTSTEQIATAAGVSKQTVYNQFADKRSLFSSIILGVTATAEAFVEDLPRDLAGVESEDDVRPALTALARRYLAVVTDPQVLALRRLVISEAHRFPELATAYYAGAPARVLAALAAQFERLGALGVLRVDDAPGVAEDFAFLLLGRVLDQGMFHDPTDNPAARDLDARADHAVDVLLAAYGRSRRAGG